VGRNLRKTTTSIHGESKRKDFSIKKDPPIHQEGGKGKEEGEQLLERGQKTHNPTINSLKKESRKVVLVRRIRTRFKKEMSTRVLGQGALKNLHTVTGYLRDHTLREVGAAKRPPSPEKQRGTSWERVGENTLNKKIIKRLGGDKVKAGNWRSRKEIKDYIGGRGNTSNRSLKRERTD